MLEIRYDHTKDRFQARGAFHLGCIGTYTAPDFDSPASILTVEDIRPALWRNQRWNPWKYGPIRALLSPGEQNPERIAQALTFYYQSRAQSIRQNRRQIHNCFLIHIYEHLSNCAYPFWEHPGAARLEHMPQVPADRLASAVYSSAVCEAVHRAALEYNETPNNGTLSKTDIEVQGRRWFPMLDIDALLASIRPEALVLDGPWLCFQCSDTLGRPGGTPALVLCSAYAELRPDNSLHNWSNF